MTRRVFIISNTHFGHKKILEFEAQARPFATIEEHDEALVERWNAAVSKDDIVWHLGDVLFGAKSFDILPRLNGAKNLILGNHDHYPLARYAPYFRTIHACAVVRDCLLTHVPIHPSQFYRFRANFHGHTHSKKLDDPRYVPVSAEHTGLAPILLDTLMLTVPEKETTA